MELSNPHHPIGYDAPLKLLLLLVFQLLNQFENTGPPPADKEKIQALPTVPVTEEHVGMLSCGWWTESLGASPAMACLSLTCFLCRLRAGVPSVQRRLCAG